MSTQTYLLPTLYSLLPSPSYLQTTCRLSLQSLHVETLTIHETIYTTTHPIIPGQHRSLHLRARARSKLQPPAHVQSQRRSEVDGEKGERKWEYELVYLSSPLSAREYSEMSVRACVSLDVVGSSTRLELEDFVKALGFEWVLSAIAGGAKHSLGIRV